MPTAASITAHLKLNTSQWSKPIVSATGVMAKNMATATDSAASVSTELARIGAEAEKLKAVDTSTLNLGGVVSDTLADEISAIGDELGTLQASIDGTDASPLSTLDSVSANLQQRFATLGNIGVSIPIDPAVRVSLAALTSDIVVLLNQVAQLAGYTLSSGLPSELQTITTTTVDSTARLSEFRDALGHAKRSADAVKAGEPVAALTEIKDGLEGVSAAATNTQFNIRTVSRVMAFLYLGLKPVELLTGRFASLNSLLRLTTEGVARLAGGFGFASTLATTLATGVGFVLAVLQPLLIIPSLIARAFGFMFAVILAPFRVLITLASLAAKGLSAILAPVVAIAAGFFQLKVAIGTLKLQAALFLSLMTKLPPTLRLVVGGLLALGVAGRVGTVAIKAGKAALMGFNVSARITRIALKLVTLQWVSAARLTVKSAFDIVKAAGRVTVSALLATRALGRMASGAVVGGLKRLGRAARSAGSATFSKMIGGAKAGMAALLALAAVAGSWGVANAASTETAQVQFGTFLQDIDQGKALVAEITKFSAATPFSNDSLRESTALLLNSDIAADKITGKLTQLGDVAAGVNKPIEEIAATYQKLAAKPKIGLGELNQLAEKGVPIYRELETVTGKSRAELFKMISAGKVGLPQVDQALQNLTTGTGVFAGGMAKQSVTLAGLFSTLKDNVGILFETISGAFLKIFNVKGLMASFTSFVQFLAGQVQRITAIIAVYQEVFSAVFAAIAEIGTSVFATLFGAGSSTFDNLLESFTVYGALVAWGFANWPTLANVAFKSIALFGLTAFNDLAFFFTDQMPAFLSWFGRNWKSVFFDAASVVQTVFTNIGKNIVNAMTAIWDFIASGGTQTLALSWTPLLDGFESTLSELPDIPERSLSALEQTMTADLDRMKENLGESMGDAVTASLDRLKSTLGEKNEPIKLEAVTGDQIRRSDDAAGKEATKRDSFVVSSLQQDSADALRAIFGAQDKDKTPEQTLSVQKQMLAEIRKANKKGPISIGVAGAVV